MLVIDMHLGSAIILTHLPTTAHRPHIRTGLHLGTVRLSGTHHDLLLQQPTLGSGHQHTVIPSTEAEAPGRHEVVAATCTTIASEQKFSIKKKELIRRDFPRHLIFYASYAASIPR